MRVAKRRQSRDPEYIFARLDLRAVGQLAEPPGLHGHVSRQVVAGERPRVVEIVHVRVDNGVAGRKVLHVVEARCGADKLVLAGHGGIHPLALAVAGLENLCAC